MNKHKQMVDFFATPIYSKMMNKIGNSQRYTTNQQYSGGYYSISFVQESDIEHIQYAIMNEIQEFYGKI